MSSRSGRGSFGLAGAASATLLLLYPRAAQKESESELARLLEELASLSDEEAQLRLDHELQDSEAVAA